MIHSRSMSFMVLALAMLLAGCESGGGGGSVPLGVAPSPTTTPPSGTQLDSRDMPGTGLMVITETPITAGQTASVRIEAPDVPAGTQLAVAVGTDRESLTAATITSLSANHWRAAMTLPNPLPAGSCVLVTLTLADGSVLESGLDDFVLRPKSGTEK